MAYHGDFMAYLQFGEFTLDMNAYRIFNQEQELSLEPKTLEVLLLLIAHRDRVVHKAELLEQIWHGRNVVDNVLSRSIYELRKALGDSSNNQRYIRTVRGKGYQFIADIGESEESPLKSPNVVQNQNSKQQYGFWALGVLLLAIGAYFLVTTNYFRVDDSLTSAENTSTKPQPIVGVLPIEVKSNDPQLSILSVAISDYLGNRLATGLGVTVLHPDSIAALIQENDDIWAIQKLTQADYLIQGHIEKIPEANTARLYLTLYSKFEGNQLTPVSLGHFEISLPNSSDGLLNMYRERQVLVKNILRLIRPGIVVEEDKTTETESPEAYRLVIAAHRMISLGDCKLIERIDELLQKAVDIDPEFAYAWRLIYSNHYRRVWMCSESTSYYEQALEAAAQADRLLPGRYDVLVTGRVEILTESNRAEEAFELVGDIAGQDVKVLNRAVYVLRYAGFLQRSAAMMETILQRAPLNYSGRPVMQSPNVLLYQNRFSQYLLQLSNSGFIYHDFYRALVAHFQNDDILARQILVKIITEPSDNIFLLHAQSLLSVIDGEQAAAIATVENIAQRRQAIGNIDGEMTYKQAQLMAMAGDTEAALNQLSIAVEQGFFCVSYFLHDPAMGSLREHARFNAIVVRAAQRHLAFAQRFGLTPELPPFAYGSTIPQSMVAITQQ